MKIDYRSMPDDDVLTKFRFYFLQQSPFLFPRATASSVKYVLAANVMLKKLYAEIIIY